MAQIIRTIGVSGQLHVLRQGNAVSCLCCDQECCLYSAQALIDGLYGIADLPETVVAYGQDGGYQITFTKTGSSPAYYEGDAEVQTRIIINQDGEVASWELQTFEEVESEWSSFQDTSPNPCLVFEPFAENLAFVGDEFEQSYQVTTPIASGTISRTSLCVWEGTDSNGCPLLLEYQTRLSPEDSYLKWTISFSEGGLVPCSEFGRAIKTPNQSSPEGDYAAPGGGGVLVTVASA